jgi:AP-3 complex subunit delta-1
VSPGQLCVPRPWASDDDQSVVQAAVTVLSELAMHNPKTYLPLAPKVGQCRLTLSNPS